jgi:ABC-type spermidine/putrescine transport system permease subunit I
MKRDAGHDATRMRLGPLAVADWLLVGLLFLTPIVFMLYRSFGRANPITLDVEVVGTLQSYRSLWSPIYRPVLLRSLVLSGLTVAMCVVIGTPAALALSRLGGQRRQRVLLLVMLPSFVSFTVRIFAWQGILAKGGPIESLTGARLLFSPQGVFIGMITAYVPLFVLPAYVALSRVPNALIEASADLGAKHWRQMISVTLPLAAVGLATGAVLVAVLSAGEFIVPRVLGGGKVLLLGNILSERGAGRDQPLGGAITAFMLVAFAVAGCLFALVRRRSRREGASLHG